MPKVKSFHQGRRVRMTDTIFIGHDGTVIYSILSHKDMRTMLYTIELDEPASKFLQIDVTNVILSQIKPDQFKFLD